mgnify:CR=1 FL=1
MSSTPSSPSALAFALATAARARQASARPPRRALAIAALLVPLLCGAPATAKGTARPHATAPRTSAPSPAAGKGPAKVGKVAKVAKVREPEGRSVGSPTEGHLVGGVRLAEGDALRISPAYAGNDVRYGTRALVHLVERASKRVKQRFPDAVLTVGHLSKHGGGEIDHHASHESGRDADLAFYVKSSVGKPLYAPSFVAFAGDGKARAWPGAHFDDARNWALVEALVHDPEARVTHIFVAQPLHDRLMAYAQSSGVPLSTRIRVAEVLAQPRGALPHDDHFHVRIACPGGMRGCIENPARRTSHKKHAGAKTDAARGGASRAPASHGRRDAGHHAAKAAPPRASTAPAPKPPAPRADDDARDTDPQAAPTGAAEPSIPKLGPVVPGLDSVVIPAPLDDVDGQP